MKRALAKLDRLETTLNNLVNHSGWPRLPEQARNKLADALWWLALVSGVITLLVNVRLWASISYVSDRKADFLNEYYGYAVSHPSPNLFFYLAFTVGIVQALLLLLAAPTLKARKKAGWNLLFYAILLGALYGLVRTFSAIGGGFGGLLWTAVVVGISIYLLFQVRDYFITPGKSAVKKH